MSQPHHELIGRHVLVVEDEYYIAADMVEALESYGAHVVGPAASVEEAVKLVNDAARIDAAVVDLNLQGEMAFPVAEVLIERQIPFVFATGYDAQMIPTQYHHVKRCEKPVDFLKVAGVLFTRTVPVDTSPNGVAPPPNSR